MRLRHPWILLSRAGSQPQLVRKTRTPQPTCRLVEAPTCNLGRVPLAEIYPLVTARALARAFTYEVEDGVERGAGGLGLARWTAGARCRRRVGVEAPAGVAIGLGRAGRRPGPGAARRARAVARRVLRLDTGPRARARRTARASQARRAAGADAAAMSFAGEAEPEELTAAQLAAIERDHGSALRRRGPRSPARPDGERQDGGLPPGHARRRSRAGSARSCSCPRSP